MIFDIAVNFIMDTTNNGSGLLSNKPLFSYHH